MKPILRLASFLPIAIALAPAAAVAGPVSLLPADAAVRLADRKPGLFEHLEASGQTPDGCPMRTL